MLFPANHLTGLYPCVDGTTAHYIVVIRFGFGSYGSLFLGSL